MKRKIAVIMASVMMLSMFVLSGCGSSDDEKKDPDIQVNVSVAGPNIEEYKNIEIENLKEINREDFKVVQIEVYAEYSEKYSDMKMTVPKFKDNCGIADDIQRYISGDSSLNENDIDRISKYEENFVLYTKGMTEKDIKTLLNKHKLTVEYKNSDGETEKQEIALGDSAKFIK